MARCCEHFTKPRKRYGKKFSCDRGAASLVRYAKRPSSLAQAYTSCCAQRFPGSSEPREEWSLALRAHGCSQAILEAAISNGFSVHLRSRAGFARKAAGPLSARASNQAQSLPCSGLGPKHGSFVLPLL